MTWLGSWLQKAVGSWLGTTEPAIPGAIAARMAGTSTFTGNLQVTRPEQVFVDLSATLPGTSTCSGSIEVVEIIHVVDDMAATLAGISSFSGNLQTGAIIPVHGGGGIRRIVKTVRSWWKPKPVYVDLAANISGNSTTTSKLSVSSVLSAGLAGSSSIKAGLVLDYREPVKSIVVPESTPSIVVPEPEIDHVTVSMAAAIGGRSSFTAGLVTAYRKPPIAADNHDDEMMMVLMLAA